MMVGERPTDLPFGTFIIFQKELESYLESEIEMQKQAVLEALVEFWNNIN